MFELLIKEISSLFFILILDGHLPCIMLLLFSLFLARIFGSAQLKMSRGKANEKEPIPGIRDRCLYLSKKAPERNESVERIIFYSKDRGSYLSADQIK